MKYAIISGLGGGFNSIMYQTVIELPEPNLDSAISYARELAIDEYDSYAGLHGLPDIQDIIEEYEVSEEEAYEILSDEIESWIGYEAIPVPDAMEFDENSGETAEDIRERVAKHQLILD